jgi:hypothetical protein
MSKSSRNYRPNKRKGSQPIQTKRSPKNKHRWEKQVGYAVRMMNRAFYFKHKS